MTTSERAIVGVIVLGVMAGSIAGQAWPQDHVGVSKALGAFCVAAVLVLTAVVLHARRGRP